MTCFELTTETPEGMITLLRGLNLEVTKDEPVYKVQKPTILRPEDVQTEEGLGEAPEEAAPESDRNPIDDLADEVEELANDVVSENRVTLIKAAKALRILSKYLQDNMGKNISTTLELAFSAGLGKGNWMNE